MDGVMLLEDAHSAGLTVRVDGDRLVLRGPPSAEAVAKKLLWHKGDVMKAMTASMALTVVETGNDTDLGPQDLPPCPSCGSLELWQDLLGGWHCQRCNAVALLRSRRLLERAARLRKAARTKTAAWTAHVASARTGPIH